MTFTTQPVNKTVDRGGDTSFSCTYSLMNVNITWNGPGFEAGSTTQSTVNMDANTSTLTITNVNSSHAGGYFCTAHSEGMDINSTVAYLKINCKYIINYYEELKALIPSLRCSR